MTRRRYIDPQDFRDLRRWSGLTRKEAAQALDVTPRTIQNWENGGARIPWVAYRMLRILRGYALPGQEWEGWTVRGGELVSPAGRIYGVEFLTHIEQIFQQARLWRLMYSRSGRARTAERVIPFPDPQQIRPEACIVAPDYAGSGATQPQRIGGLAA